MHDDEAHLCILYPASLNHTDSATDNPLLAPCSCSAKDTLSGRSIYTCLSSVWAKVVTHGL